MISPLSRKFDIGFSHQGIFLKVFNNLGFISLIYYVYNLESSQGFSLVGTEVHTNLKIISTSYCKERCYGNVKRTGYHQFPQDCKTLNIFYSCCHFILWKWKVLFTGIKFSFSPRKSEILYKNYKFPQQQLHKNVWSCPSGCLLTCLKWKAVCTHGWKYTHQEKLIMQIFAKREQ